MSHYFFCPSHVPSKRREELKFLCPTRVLLNLIDSMVKGAKDEKTTLREFLSDYMRLSLYHVHFDEKLELPQVLEWIEEEGINEDKYPSENEFDFWEDIHCHALKEADGFTTVQAINNRLQEYGVRL
jgi:hypothetical protein